MDVDDTLVLILERINSLVSLIRAASTCRRWRRIIADAGFLRRFRSLHGPPVAGDYHNGDHRDGEDGRISSSRHDPWFVPSPWIDGRHFSLDFILGMSIFPPLKNRWYNTESWMVLDSRGSLLLMECIHDTSSPFPDLVVCEPLTQRYKIIPQPPDLDDANNCRFVGFPYLVDGDEDAAGGRIGMSNFRVLCVLLSHDDTVAHTTMFTASSDMDAMWSEKGIDKIASRLHSRSTERIYMDHVLGSSYYYLPKDGTLITHDGSIGKFSLSMLPQAIKDCYDARIWTENFAVVDGGDGEPRIITIMNHNMGVFARVDGKWAFEKKVLLSKVACSLPGYQPSFFDKHLTIVKTGVGFVVIRPHQGRLRWPFSVDLKTMEVAPAAKDTRENISYHCEFPWPPVLKVICLDI